MTEKKYKCIVEINVTADRELDAIQKLENILEDHNSFDIRGIIAFQDYLDIRYGAKVDD